MYADDTAIFVRPECNQTLCHLATFLGAVNKWIQTIFIELSGKKSNSLLVRRSSYLPQLQIVNHKPGHYPRLRHTILNPTESESESFYCHCSIKYNNIFI